MIKPADRLALVSEYYFSNKLRQIASMREAGIDVISLGIGSPDMPPSEETIDCLCEAAHGANMHGYQPCSGIPELRKAFADWYARYYGVELNPANEIQPLIGSKEGILHVTLAFVNPGDEVLVPNPGYPTYTSLSKLLGAKVVYYDLKEENGWLPDFDELDKMDMSRVKLMWTNYPHMPTGTNASEELLERLVDFARRKGIVLVNDNPYSFILNEHPKSILAVKGAKDCCIEFNSLSKSHNMPGWRVAMLASNAEFVSWILKVKSNIDKIKEQAVKIAEEDISKLSDASVENVYFSETKDQENYSYQNALIFVIKGKYTSITETNTRYFEIRLFNTYLDGEELAYTKQSSGIGYSKKEDIQKYSSYLNDEDYKVTKIQ